MGLTNFSASTIICVIIVGEVLLVLKLISVHQLFSVVPVLICEITVITAKTFGKTRVSCLCGWITSAHQKRTICFHFCWWCGHLALAGKRFLFRKLVCITNNVAMWSGLITEFKCRKAIPSKMSMIRLGQVGGVNSFPSVSAKKVPPAKCESKKVSSQQ